MFLASFCLFPLRLVCGLPGSPQINQNGDCAKRTSRKNRKYGFGTGRQLRIALDGVSSFVSRETTWKTGVDVEISLGAVVLSFLWRHHGTTGKIGVDVEISPGVVVLSFLWRHHGLTKVPPGFELVMKRPLDLRSPESRSSKRALSWILAVFYSILP